MRPDADLSPPGVARLIADLLAALDLREVTPVGNDTGGAICQLVATQHPERLARLVLTNCDTYRDFLPLALRRAAGRRHPGGPAGLAGRQRDVRPGGRPGKVGNADRGLRAGRREGSR